MRRDTFVAPDELIRASEDAETSPYKLQYVTLEVYNAGRGQLDDLEAIVGAYKPLGPIAGDEVSPAVPLTEIPILSNGMGEFEIATAEAPRVLIPPRAKRVLRIAYIGSTVAVCHELERRNEELPTAGTAISAALAIWPKAGSDRITWINDDDLVAVEISLAARNCRARRWWFVARFYAWDADDEMGVSGVSTDWIAPLRQGRFPGFSKADFHR